VNQEFNIKGKYKVRFFIDGEEKIVTIDDFIAIDKNDNSILFSYSKGSELYVSLLEKAWAKVCENFGNTKQG
jgi:hypothetical protein